MADTANTDGDIPKTIKALHTMLESKLDNMSQSMAELEEGIESLGQRVSLLEQKTQTLHVEGEDLNVSDVQEMKAQDSRVHCGSPRDDCGSSQVCPEIQQGLLS